MTLDNIQQIACVGGGVIGSSWAIQFAMKGLSTTLYDINQEQLDKSEKPRRPGAVSSHYSPAAPGADRADNAHHFNRRGRKKRPVHPGKRS